MMSYDNFLNSIKTPEKLLVYMSNNISYGYLGKNDKVYFEGDSSFDDDWYSQYVLESFSDVLHHSCGNCWDQVEFEREWFLKHHYKIKTIFEMVAIDRDNSYPTHSFLVYQDKNQRWNWFENADFKNRGIHSFSSYEELIHYQYEKYLELLRDYAISDEDICHIRMVEFNSPKIGSSAQEYLEFVSSFESIHISK